MTVSKKKLQDILAQVPVNYYAKGVKTNLLQKYWHEKKWAHICRVIPKVSGKFLDVGCADGTTTYNISKKFPKLKITGVDYYKGAIDFAKKRWRGISFVCADAHKMPFKSDSFDIICTIEALEHMTQPDKVLSEIQRILKKNGYFVVVQDTDSLLFKIIWWFWTKSKGSVWTNSHINCVGPQTLLSYLKRAKFSIDSVKMVNLGMEVIILARKM